MVGAKSRYRRTRFVNGVRNEWWESLDVRRRGLGSAGGRILCIV